MVFPRSDLAKGERTLWFRKRRLGWGISPSSWQGWAVTVVYSVVVVLFGSAFHKNLVGGLIGMAIASVLFFVVVAATGEKPGHRSNDEHN